MDMASPSVPLLLLAAVGGLWGQDAARFRTDVRQVRLDVRVAMPDGSAVASLTQGDLVVLEDGEPRPFTHFAYDSEPLDIVLLFDTSGSMKSHTEAIAAVSRTALSALKAGDRVAVMAFDEKPRLFESFLSNPDEIAGALSSLVASETFIGGTVINHAIQRAADYLVRRARPGSRRTIVLFTDNVGQKGVSDEDTEATLERAEAALNVLLYAWKEKSPRRGSADATMLADRTGGEVMRMERAAVSFRDMLERLRQRYTIYYGLPDSASAGSSRSVQVLLTTQSAERHPGAIVRSRRHYRVPGGEPEGK
jgi:VWFA-related protein